MQKLPWIFLALQLPFGHTPPTHLPPDSPRGHKGTQRARTAGSAEGDGRTRLDNRGQREGNKLFSVTTLSQTLCLLPLHLIRWCSKGLCPPCANHGAGKAATSLSSQGFHVITTESKQMMYTIAGGAMGQDKRENHGVLQRLRRKRFLPGVGFEERETVKL